MRERAVPCRNATGYEAVRGRHYTFADDRLCDRCKNAAAASPTARAAQASADSAAALAALLPGTAPSAVPGLPSPVTVAGAPASSVTAVTGVPPT